MYYFTAIIALPMGNTDFHIMCYHALWQVVGAFGFVVLWAFNSERFDCMVHN